MEASTADPFFYAIALAVVLFVLISATSLKIVKESERLAVFILGRYAGLRGPGLVMLPPGIAGAHRLALGAVGTYMGSNLVRLDGFEVPIAANPEIRARDSVRICSFDGNEVHVERTDTPARKFRCEKCGHINTVYT